jgi:hypothetical protein
VYIVIVVIKNVFFFVQLAWYDIITNNHFEQLANIYQQTDKQAIHYQALSRLQSFCSSNQNVLLTYSIYFSYAIFLTDYKKILKIAGEVKQLTVPLLPDPNCSMLENDAQCVIPVKRTSDHSVRWADIIIFSGFVVMCMYIR